jgi:peptidoglycan/xylan/chitin deacetylase (PgdA/CDA1 family)
MADQLTRTEAAIAPLAGQTTRPWFRPPYGAWNANVRTAVGAAGWGYLVMWDVDTIDWKPTSDGGPTTDDIVAKVLSRAQGGSIVLMHLGGYNTLDALPRIVDGLRQKGLTPVTLGEMFGR